MTNLDPQTTADFWDAYVTVATADTDLVQAAVTVYPRPIQLWNRPSGS